MTDDDIKKAREIIDAATPGPWKTLKKVLVVNEWSEHIGDFHASSNAAFIAAAREGWPAALDEVTRLRADLETVQSRAKNWTEDCAESVKTLLTENESLKEMFAECDSDRCDALEELWAAQAELKRFKESEHINPAMPTGTYRVIDGKVCRVLPGTPWDETRLREACTEIADLKNTVNEQDANLNTRGVALAMARQDIVMKTTRIQELVDEINSVRAENVRLTTHLPKVQAERDDAIAELKFADETITQQHLAYDTLLAFKTEIATERDAAVAKCTGLQEDLDGVIQNKRVDNEYFNEKLRKGKNRENMLQSAALEFHLKLEHAQAEFAALKASRDAWTWPQPCVGCAVPVGDAWCAWCASRPEVVPLRVKLLDTEAELTALKARYDALLASLSCTGEIWTP